MFWAWREDNTLTESLNESFIHSLNHTCRWADSFGDEAPDDGSDVRGVRIIGVHGCEDEDEAPNNIPWTPSMEDEAEVERFGTTSAAER